MENPNWPKALAEACVHAHHPALHYDYPEGIVMQFLEAWGGSPSDLRPLWEHAFDQVQEDDEHVERDIFSLLQCALTEGGEEDRVFALFLLGGLATSKARDMLISFLASPHRKERWASAISLGRLKEERVFTLLQTLLLEGFAASEIFESVEDLQRAREVCRLYRGTLGRQEPEALITAYWNGIEHLRDIDYEWYLRQRSECALVLGAWGKPAAAPKLREALQAVWRMEQDWPDYQGPDEDGPTIWYFFQDRLVFALGQLGIWDALTELSFPETNLLVARIYLILGALQAKVPDVFWHTEKVFRYYLMYSYIDTMCRHSSLTRGDIISKWVKRGDIVREELIGVNTIKVEIIRAEAIREERRPLVESEPAKQLLAEHFGFSPTEQEDYLLRFFKASVERAKESQGGDR